MSASLIGMSNHLGKDSTQRITSLSDAAYWFTMLKW